MSKPWNFVSDVESAKYIAPNPPKTQKMQGASGTYIRMYTHYNYGTDQRPKCSEALHELKICNATIRSKDKDNGSVEWRLNIMLDDQDDIAGLEKVNQGIIGLVEKHHLKFGFKKFDRNNVEECYRPIFFFPSDKDTGELVQGARPILSLKINNNSKFQAMVDAKGKTEVVKHTDFKDFHITCSLVFAVNNLYRSSNGGVIIPQTYVRDCIILNASPKGEIDHSNSEAVMAYLTANPEMVTTLAEQLEKIKAGQATTLLQPANPQHQPPAQLAPPMPSPTTSQMSYNQPQYQLPPMPAGLPQPMMPPAQEMGNLNISEGVVPQPGTVTLTNFLAGGPGAGHPVTLKRL